MPVDRGKGLFRLAWVVVSLVFLALIVAATRPGARGLGVERRLTEDELRLPRRCATAGPTGARPTSPRAAGRRRGCRRCSATAPAAARALALATLPEENRERLACAACGFIAYVNPRLVVTTIPVTDAGEVDPAPAGDRARARLVGAAGRVPRGRRDGRTRRRSARRSRRRGCSSSRARSSGCTRGSRRRSSSSRSRRAIAGGEAADDARGARGARRSRPTAIPWGEIAFKTSFFAIRDWVRRRAPGRRGPGRLPAARGRGAGASRTPAQPRSTNTFLSSVYCSSASSAEVLADPRLLVAAERRLDVDAVVAVDRDDARLAAPSPPAARARCRGSRPIPTGRRATRSRSAAPPRPCRTG